MQRPYLPVVLALAFVAQGCDPEGCLAAAEDEACTVPSPCQELAFTCDDTDVAIIRLEATDERPGGLSALGAVHDFLLTNSRIAAVIDAIDHPHFIAPSGGSILDLTTRGGDNDSINNIFQATGLLPWDGVLYTAHEIIEPVGSAQFAAIQFRGHLDGRPGVRVSTRYEVRPCEPGVRVRTEVVNNEPDPLVWTVADGVFWGGKSNLPFAPTPGAGFEHPSFGLTTIDSAFRETPYVVGTAHSTPAAAYAMVACNAPALYGFHSEFVSSVGTERKVVQPRDYVVHERFIAVASGRNVSAAADIALELRSQLFDEHFIEISGRVRTPDGDGLFGREERASVTLLEGTLDTPEDERIPWTQVAPASDGEFRVRVPARLAYLIEVQAFGKVITTEEVVTAAGSVDVGAIEIPEVGSVTLSASLDGAPTDAQVFFHPTTSLGREAVAAKLHGGFVECAPLLGAPHGPSPACNRVLISDPVTVAVPAGTYDIYATAGPFVTLARKTVEVGAGQAINVDLSLQRLGLLNSGWLSGDFHVHGAASEDTMIPHTDRVRAFLAAGIDVIVSTEHDVVFDYAEARATLNADERLVLITGTESTGHILYKWFPNSTTPKVNGHWNYWPLDYDPAATYRGAPWDELAEPGLLLTRMESAGWPADYGVAQLNHPIEESEFGRDLGWANAIEIDLTLPLEEDAPETAQGIFHRTPAGARYANSEYHAQEVMNGTANHNHLPFRAFWFYLLNQGELRAGTANSDSHSLSDSVLGTPRNLIRTSTQVSGFDIVTFNQDVRAGRMVGTNGPLIEVSTTGSDGVTHQPELTPFAPAEDARLSIRVVAAPWVPVEEIRVVVNGKVVSTLSDELSHPYTPFGFTGVIRYEGELSLADLLPAGNGDAWLIVEAGAPLPMVGDLDCNGVPDTGDNNDDGVVDWRDVDRNEDDVVDDEDTKGGEPAACDDDVGPLHGHAPTTDRNDPAYHFEAVVPGGYPAAFTNPLVFDRDGNGFGGPGL